RRDLPTPASPLTTATVPVPAAAVSQDVVSSASSASRATSAVPAWTTTGGYRPSERHTEEFPTPVATGTASSSTAGDGIRQRPSGAPSDPEPIGPVRAGAHPRRRGRRL